MDQQARGLQGVVWIHLAQNINQFQACVRASRGRKLGVKAAYFLAYQKGQFWSRKISTRHKQACRITEYVPMVFGKIVNNFVL